MAGVCNHARLPPPDLGCASTAPRGPEPANRWACIAVPTLGQPQLQLMHVLNTLGESQQLCHSICVNCPVEKMRESLTARVDAPRRRGTQRPMHVSPCSAEGLSVPPRTSPEARGLVLGSICGIVLAPLQSTQIMNCSTLKVNPKRRLSKRILSN